MQTTLLALYRTRSFLALLLVLVSGSPAPAGMPPESSIRPFFQNSRTQIDGRAFSVTSLAQSADGFLWIGTADGLFQYDGLVVTPFDPASGERLPSELVTSLRAASSGALWIGTSAGLSYLRNGRLTTYTTAQGLPPGQVLSLLEDRAGVVWVGTGSANGGGLVSIDTDGLKFHRLSGQPRGCSILSLLEDHDRNLWIGTTCGLYQRRPDSASLSFVRAGSIASMVHDPSAGLWLIESAKGLDLIPFDRRKPSRAQSLGIAVPSTLLRDRRGRVWVGTAGQGLFQLRNGKPDQLARRDGLSSDLITTMFEDTEGNLWLGTAGGLDQLREPQVKRWSTTEGLLGNFISAVEASSRGGLWAGAYGGGLHRIEDGKLTSRLPRSWLKGANITALHEDRNGRLWIATTDGLGLLSQSRFLEVPGPKGTSLKRIFGIASDVAGNLWVADAGAGLLKVVRDQTQQVAIPGKEARNVYTLYVRPNGELWVGYFEGGITVLKDGAHYEYRNGLAPGSINHICEDSAGTIWVATSGGLSRLRNGRWTTWTQKQHLPKGGVHALLEDWQGRLWMMTAEGLLYTDRRELDASRDGYPDIVSYAVIGPGEGFRPRRSRTLFNPRMTMSTDGTLWVSTDDGLASIDPARMRRDKRTLQAMISRVKVDGNSLDLAVPEVAFRGDAVELEYTAPAFISPERVRFRYRLDGRDADWIDAGPSRKIVYATFPIGRHTFHVQAIDDYGSRNASISTVVLHRLPRFYQTRLFLLASLLLMTACAYVLYRLRIRQIRARFQLILGERARLTREIHDTVLQGFVGVVYQLHAASSCFDRSPQVSKEKLSRALDQAERSVQETRRVISCMRLPILERLSLPEALSTMGKQTIEGQGISFNLSVKGPVRQLRYEAQAALYMIAREAVANAVNHGQPGSINLALHYSETDVRLTVRDTGTGFDPSRPRAEGHFGLAGMHERASEVGATFEVASQPGRGTTVSVYLIDRRCEQKVGLRRSAAAS